MNEIILQVLSTGIVAALFSGMVSLLVFKLKFDFDKTLHHNDVASEKLNHIINPLIFVLKVKTSDLISDDQLIVSKVKESGHLLTTELYNAVLKMMITENQIKQSLDNNPDGLEVLQGTYSQLKDQVLRKLTVEQSELTRLSNKNFEKYRKNSLSSSAEKNYKIIEMIGSWIVYISIMIVVLILMYIDVSKNPNFSDSNIWYIFGLLIVSLLGFVFIIIGLVSIIPKLLGPFIETNQMSKNRFKANKLVKRTGKYKCRVCDSIVHQYEGTWFTYCRHENAKSLLKKVYVDYYWTFSSEI